MSSNTLRGIGQQKGDEKADLGEPKPAADAGPSDADAGPVVTGTDEQADPSARVTPTASAASGPSGSGASGSGASGSGASGSGASASGPAQVGGPGSGPMGTGAALAKLLAESKPATGTAAGAGGSPAADAIAKLLAARKSPDEGGNPAPAPAGQASSKTIPAFSLDRTVPGARSLDATVPGVVGPEDTIKNPATTMSVPGATPAAEAKGPNFAATLFGVPAPKIVHPTRETAVGHDVHLQRDTNTAMMSPSGPNLAPVPHEDLAETQRHRQRVGRDSDGHLPWYDQLPSNEEVFEDRKPNTVARIAIGSAVAAALIVFGVALLRLRGQTPGGDEVGQPSAAPALAVPAAATANPPKATAATETARPPALGTEAPDANKTEPSEAPKTVADEAAKAAVKGSQKVADKATETGDDKPARVRDKSNKESSSSSSHRRSHSGSSTSAGADSGHRDSASRHTASATSASPPATEPVLTAPPGPPAAAVTPPPSKPAASKKKSGDYDPDSVMPLSID